MRKPDSSLKHIFLLAKGHYNTNGLNVIEAMRVVIAERCGLHYQHVTIRDVYTVIFICLEQIENLNWAREFENFVLEFYCNSFKMEGYNDNTDECRIARLLATIACTQVKHIKFDLAKEDRSEEIQKLLNHQAALKTISQWKGLGYKALRNKSINY